MVNGLLARVFGRRQQDASPALEDLRLEAKRGRALVEESREIFVVLDTQDRVVAASRRAKESFQGLAEGAPVPEAIMRDSPLVVSHELRTPLARLLALLETALLPGSETHGLIEQAQAEVGQIRELIDDVLFLSELESGRELVGLGSTQGLPVLREVVAGLTEQSERADVRLVVTGSEDVDVPLRPRMLRVIAANLAENAFRYAGPGATLTFTLEPSDGTVVLTASDDGAGVSDEDIPRLFERFYRADRARASRGTGLGLAIVKHIVTSAGGSVEASGAPGRGLTIRCVFPPG